MKPSGITLSILIGLAVLAPVLIAIVSPETMAQLDPTAVPMPSASLAAILLAVPAMYLMRPPSDRL